MDKSITSSGCLDTISSKGAEQVAAKSLGNPECSYISLYDGFTNSCTEYIATGSVADTLHTAAPNIDVSKCVCIVAGHAVSACYVPSNGEIVFVREMPGAVGCMIAMAVVGVVSAVASLGLSIYAGIMQRQAQKEADQAARNAKKMAEQVTQLPFLKGAKNRVALGYNIPYIMGTMYDVPYKITNGCYRISGGLGAKQEWLCSFVVGYAPLDISDIKCGTGKLPGTAEVVSVGDYTNSVLSPLNTKITATSYGDEIPHKAGDGSQWIVGVTKQLEQHTYRADVCIMFNGLRHFNSKHGAWWPSGCTIRVDYSEDGGATWCENLTRFEVYENAGITIRFEKTINFTPSQCYGKDLSLRFVRTTSCAESSGQDTCYLAYINCWQYDAAKSTKYSIVPCMPLEMPWRDKVVRLGVCIESSDSTRDTLDEVNCMATARARVWDSETHTWTVDKRPTRNSAAWVLEVLTSSCHPASAFDDSEVDLDAFGALYEMCQAEHFYCDGIVSEDTKKESLLSQILMECGATMFIGADGKWTVSYEGRKTTPIALLNEESIISITASKDFSRRPFGIKATFTNRDVWANDTRYMAIDEHNNVITGSEAVMAARGGDKSKVITEAAFKYITEWQHLCKVMRRQMSKQKLQTREITVNVGHEGDLYPLYSLVMLQTHALKTGLASGVIRSVKAWGGRIKEMDTGGLCPFLDSRMVYGMVVQHQGHHVYIKVEPVDGADGGFDTILSKGAAQGAAKSLNHQETTSVRTRHITIVGGAREGEVAAGDIYSFGELDSDGGFSTITTTMQITGVKQSATGWELSLRDYSDMLYDDNAPVPVYHSNITIPRTTSTVLKTPTVSDMTEELIAASKNITVNVIPDVSGKEAAELVTHGVHFTSVHQIPDMETSLEDVIRMVDEARLQTMDGISVTSDMILMQISDTEKELRAALAIQAGAITAMVEGGGAQGQMQLSIELPALINQAQRDALVEAINKDGKDGEALVSAVYALSVDSSGNAILYNDDPTNVRSRAFSHRYGIMGNVSQSAVKALWDEAVKVKMLASQVELEAEQILLNGHTIVNGELDAPLIRADALDVEALTAMALELNNGGILKSENWNGVLQSQWVEDLQKNISVIDINNHCGDKGFAMDTIGNAVFMGKTVIGSGLTVESGITQMSNAFVNGHSLDNSVIEYQDEHFIKWVSGFCVGWGELSSTVYSSGSSSTGTYYYPMGIKLKYWIGTNGDTVFVKGSAYTKPSSTCITYKMEATYAMKYVSDSSLQGSPDSHGVTGGTGSSGHYEKTDTVNNTGTYTTTWFLVGIAE